MISRFCERYPTVSQPVITPTNSETFTSISGFTETATKNEGSISYQISNDGGTTWYWYNSGWQETVAGHLESNDATIINSNISSFDIGNGEFLFRAYISSDGSYNVSLDSIEITFENDTEAPTITYVSSDKANGAYKAGEIINIVVTFSENVTSVGQVSVNLDTGVACSFVISGSNSSSCNYTVSEGQNSSDLNVSSITGEISDEAGSPMVDFSPITNLATNKNLIIDTTAPSIPGKPTSESDNSNSKPTWTWDTSADSGVGLKSPAYYLQWCDNLGFIGCSTYSSTSDTNSFTHQTNLSNGQWYFRVKARDDLDQSSSFSNIGAFYVDVPIEITPIPTPSADDTPAAQSEITPDVTSTPDVNTQDTSDNYKTAESTYPLGDPKTDNSIEQRAESSRYDLILKIVDNNNNPVENARVEIHSEVKVSYSDKNGLAKFFNVEKGEHQVIVSYDGFRSKSTLDLSGKVSEINMTIRLEKDKSFWGTYRLFIITILLVLIIFAITKIFLARRKQISR